MPRPCEKAEGDSQVTDLAARGQYSPSQHGPATVVGIRITDTTKLTVTGDVL